MSDELQAGPPSTVPGFDEPPYSDLAVPAWFGIAAQGAQAFEESLALFTVIVRLAEDPAVVPADIAENPFGCLDGQTLRRILNRAKQVVILRPDLETFLQDLIALRNRLMHRFFRDARQRMETDAGRGELIEELRQAAQRFNEGCRVLDELTDPTCKVLAASPEELDAMLEGWRDKPRPN